MPNFLNRRTFLHSGASAAAVAGLGLAAKAEEAVQGEKKEEKVDPRKILNYQPDMRYKRLGDTDIYLSVISLGGLVNEPGVHAYGIDQGVNLVHISDSYLGGRSIVDLGEVMKTKRDKVYIALKDNFFSEDEYVKGDFSKIDKWLKVLNTDYVDFFMFNRHDEKSSADPRIKDWFEKLKAMGKVRYAGHTDHDKNQKSCGAAMESGLYTLLNPVLNINALQVLEGVLQKAQEKKMGVMGMKTMGGLKTIEEQCAYLKKLLANPAITTVVKGIGSFEMFDAYKKAAGEVLTSQEEMKLYRYANANRSNTCMMCGECKGECPECIEISTVIRCKDYYFGQMGDRQTALATYHELAPSQRWSEKCGDCRKCEDVCPNGLKIVDRLAGARQLFA